MNIFIGGAWPYANGPLHIGHIAALLPGDVLARYHRARGNRVVYVSGSDCHGTPVALRAEREGRSPREISDRYHSEFTEVFRGYGFSYDLYGKTSSEEHRDYVRAFHKKLYGSGYVTEKTSPQAWCESCGRFLPDRLVAGICPRCSAAARGDQCEACVSVPDTLLQPRCAVCGNEPSYRSSRHLYIALSQLQGELERYIASHPAWRKNVRTFSGRYLAEGLRDRALTRDLSWGIEVPREGYGDKRIYIWAENVLGYLSASAEVCRRTGLLFGELWGEDARHYYVLGKDNIPFHTIILPALLLAHGGLRLPDDIVACEYLTLEGRRISTSEGHTIAAGTLLRHFDSDSLRYYLLAYGPEKRDADFQRGEYVAVHNAELVGAYGNFVHRTLAFIERSFGGRVPEGRADPADVRETEAVFASAGVAIERGELRDALRGIFEYVRACNRYYDAKRPWVTRTSDPEDCANTLCECTRRIACLAALLQPFLPRAAAETAAWLGTGLRWEPQTTPPDLRLPPVRILYERINPADAERFFKETMICRASGENND